MDRICTKETFLVELQNAHALFYGEELSKALHNLGKCLEDPSVVSPDNVQSMLSSFREIQDYNAMIKLVEDLKANTAMKFTCRPSVNQLYAFALNRRNQEGDRELAEQVIKSILEEQKNHNPNSLCLYGRIYKDTFVESGYADMESLENAIYWYRRGFNIKPNEYAGINLATLLVTKGEDFVTNPELLNISLMLKSEISKKGTLENMANYWDVATLLEISILEKDYLRAITAATRMFELKPPIWYLKSTMGNIKIINHSQLIHEQLNCPESVILSFWLKFFIEATETLESSCTRFPVVVGQSKLYTPSYAEIDTDTKTFTITNLCLEKLRGDCTDAHEFLYDADSIKSISLDNQDECLLLLCLPNKPQEDCYSFPSVHHAKRFYLLARSMFPDTVLFKSK